MYYIFLSITYFFAELMNSPILSISDCYVRYLGKFLEPDNMVAICHSDKPLHVQW